jgi:ferrochelatase
MAKFSSAPQFAHGQVPLTAVLLVQLGTPDAPTAPALRRYLSQFLSDPRVVEIPALLWQPLLQGVILRTRPAKSAAKYATVWLPEGSPLRVHTERQGQSLQAELSGRGHAIEVATAMRYGNPSIASVLRDLRARNLQRLLVLPMYPQYAGATTATVFDAVAQELSTWRNLPELRMVRNFADDEAYLDAVASGIRAQWAVRGMPDRLVLSFHGVPKRTLLAGDPYHCECHKTARLLAQRLGLAREQWVITFQSRFGRAAWLEPYTEPTLQALGREGVRRVDVACPGFVADCLETLEEIAQEARDAFLAAGGKEFNYLPCVNDGPELVQALAGIVERHSGGWPISQAEGGPASESVIAEARASAQRALALGAER